MGPSRHLRNLETFTFEINLQNEVSSTNQSTISSDSDHFDLFLDGIIYDIDEKQLLSGFISEGMDYVTKLEGSFIIFIVHHGSFYILSDKFSSRKAYYALIDDTCYISTNIDLLPKHKCQVSIDGIANYLANGVTLNGITVFEEIICTERASIHWIEKGKIAFKRYWDFKFSYSSADQINESDLQHELEKLLISSIKRRFDPEAETAISLSAGYDSRGILGILNDKIGVRNVYCFSYALDEDPIPECDAFIAKQLADKYQYKHEVIKSYKGDFIDILIKNAAEGKCLTNYSDELDAWHYLADRKGFPDIFVGDMNFGISIPFRTTENLLEKARIVESSGMKWLKSHISKKVYNEICQSLDKLIGDILQKIDNISDLQDKMDYLYLDQRINYGLLTWRENICNQVGYVHMPFLDGELLDYVSKLPPQLRDNKQMYRKTISELLPDLFAIPFPSSAGYKLNWTREIIKNKKALIALVRGSSSRLDDYIGEKELIDMIKSQNITLSKFKAFSYKTFRYIRRRIKVADKILGKISGPMGRYVSSDILIIRLLLLRIYLNDPSSETTSAIK